LPWRGRVSKHLKKEKIEKKTEQLNSYKLEKSPLLTSQASAILKDDWYKTKKR
jgi:tagatose-1,6-bisphosphate aldolase